MYKREQSSKYFNENAIVFTQSGDILGQLVYITLGEKGRLIGAVVVHAQLI